MENNAESSDDEVFWGPVTIKEIRKHLSIQKNPKRINKRATVCFTKLPIFSMEKASANAEDMSDVLPELLSSNVSITTSEHFEGDVIYQNQDEECYKQEVIKQNPSEDDSVCSLDIEKDTSEIFNEDHKDIETDVIIISSDEENVTGVKTEYRDNNLLLNEEEPSFFRNSLRFSSSSRSENRNLQETSYIKTSPTERASDTSYFSPKDLDLSEKESFVSPNSNKGKDISSIYNFDDTLEEMEMMLKQGLNYSMMDKSGFRKKSSEVSVDTSFSEIQKGDVKNEEECRIACNRLLNVRNNIVLRKPELYEHVISPVATYINQMSPSQPTIKSQFKVPSKPPKSVTKSTSFKNVISPVGVYIKNSPRTPLIQNVPSQTTKNSSRQLYVPNSTSTPTKDEMVTLPERVYKPAQHKILTKENCILLPGAIQKLVPQKTGIIKHENRIGLSNALAQDRLHDSNITDSSINTTLLNSTSEDVSVLISKKAYIS